VLVVIGNVVNKVFGETGLTGLVKSDLSSKAAVGHSCIAKSHQFLHVDIDGASGPESGIHLVERGSHLRAMGHDASA